MKELSPELIEKTKTWLGESGLQWWRDVREQYGRVDAMWSNGPVPHIVHFREGMQVRNFMRDTGLCQDWDAHDYDNNWVALIEAAIKVQA